MKRLFVLLLAVFCLVGVRAQIIRIYKGGVLIDSYEEKKTDEITFGVKSVIIKSDNTTKVYQNSELDEVSFGKREPLEYVDLALPSGTLWATCNVMADSPEKTGGLFSWGEILTKSNYDWDTYDLCNGTYKSLTKYNYSSSSGVVDNKTTLDLEYDAAYKCKGIYWRIPTPQEFEELINPAYCTCTWDRKRNGYWVTSNKNGRSIFLPATGYAYGEDVYSEQSIGFYMTNTISPTRPHSVITLELNSNEIVLSDTQGRAMGFPVRPVYSKNVVDQPTSPITVFPMNIGFRSDEDYIDVNVVCNSMWTATTSESWLELSEDSGAGSSKVMLYAYDNDSPTQRTATATFTCNGISQTVTVTQAGLTVPEYVDLGLSVKWATFNVGAKSPEDAGKYYAWGETEAKFLYNEETYFDSDCEKYNSNNRKLSLKDDVAHVKWGDKWRIPTLKEIEELNACEWVWEIRNGMPGRKFIGPNGKSIFLPAANFFSNGQLTVGDVGEYWAGALDQDDPMLAQQYSFSKTKGDETFHLLRHFGLSVRPVYGDNVEEPDPEISLNASSADFESESSSQTIIVTSNTTWTATSSSAWLKLSKTSGMGNSTITLTVSSNETNSLRTATITFTCGDIVRTINVTQEGLEATGEPEYVDLGLSVKWATFNVGSKSPEGFGDKYAWGETEIKEEYTYENYKLGNGGSYNLLDTSFDVIKYSEDIDGKFTLESSDDVAHVKWGGNWRMPTDAEMAELETMCTWENVTVNGIECRKAIGLNGNFILLPIRRKGYSEEYKYYTKTAPYRTDRKYARVVRPVYSTQELTLYTTPTAMHFTAESSVQKVQILTNSTWKVSTSASWINLAETMGTSCINLKVTAAANVGTMRSATITIKSGDVVRTLCVVQEGSNFGGSGTNNEHSYVDLGLSVAWATCNIGATTPEGYGEYFAWGETYTKSDYTDDNWTQNGKYCITGADDDRYHLAAANDVAYVKWGGNWHMPTYKQLKELDEKCTSTEETRNGVNGFKVVGPNGNSIFIPKAGYKYGESKYYPNGLPVDEKGYIARYWTKDISTNGSVWIMNADHYIGISGGLMSAGNPVRPVYSFSLTTCPMSLSYSAASSIQTIKVDATSDWSASTSVSWLSFTSSNYGTGNAELHVKAEPNLTKNVREASITVKCANLIRMIHVSQSCDSTSGRDYVDLGLSVKWATCNLGARSPEECGDRFYWKGIEPTQGEIFESDTEVDYTSKYLPRDVLYPFDDAAHVQWGGKWRIPKKEEWEELFEKCITEWDPVRIGYRFTGPNGNFIFMPAANEDLDGFSAGYYLTSTRISNVWQQCYTVGFCNARGYNAYKSIDYVTHYRGLPLIRPVCP